MRTAFFDTVCGASGDMILGALVDVGLDPRRLVELPARLGLSGVTVDVGRVRRGALDAARVEVRLAAGPDPGALTPHQHGRGLHEIAARIARAPLSERVRGQALAVFGRLADAEAAVHGVPRETVHFHEVGADDALVDVVGAALGLEALGVERVAVSALTVGTGEVRAAHGILPVPAPATARLLEGFAVRQIDSGCELLTPTGAAILTTLAEGSGVCPPMRVERSGYGAGGRELAGRANVLRCLLGRADAPVDGDRVWQLVTQVDDAPPEQLGYLQACLLEAGALDVTVSTVLMKKGRPGARIEVLAPEAERERFEALLLAEAGSFGLRRQLIERTVLRRERQTVATPYGAVRIKLGRLGGQPLVASPEYSDCAACAEAAGVAWRAVYHAALVAWHAERSGRD